MSARYDHNEHAERLRDRAKECRKLAITIGDLSARNSYQELAKAYEVLAWEEDLMTSRLPKPT